MFLVAAGIHLWCLTTDGFCASCTTYMALFSSSLGQKTFRLLQQFLWFCGDSIELLVNKNIVGY